LCDVLICGCFGEINDDDDDDDNAGLKTSTVLLKSKSTKSRVYFFYPPDKIYTFKVLTADISQTGCPS